MKPIRHSVIIPCATCERETRASAVLQLTTTVNVGLGMSRRMPLDAPEYTDVKFPDEGVVPAIIGGRGEPSGWSWSEAEQRATCPDCAQSKTAEPPKGPGG